MFGTSALRTRWQSPPGHPPLPSLNHDRKPANVPTNALGIPKDALPRIQLPKRYLRVLVTGGLLALSALFFYLNDPERRAASVEHVERPLFEEWVKKEQRLPQHDSSLRLPEGRQGQYLWISLPEQPADLAGVMQDMVIGAYLAHNSGRAYVFDNITVPLLDHPKSSALTSMPASALIAGPITGGYLPSKDRGPRSVSRLYYESVCPQEETQAINDSSSAADLVQLWIKKLGMGERRCLRLHSGRHMYSSSPYMLPHIWARLKLSPMLKDFRWSPLVHQAFNANKELFMPPKGLESLPVVGILFPEVARYAAVSGLLVVHIPLVQQEQRCAQVVRDRTEYVGFNVLPMLPDKFEAAPSADPSFSIEKHYQRHCSPTIAQITAKIQELRSTQVGRKLRNLHIITDAEDDAISDLKVSLRNTAKWEKISSSRDLVLNREQAYVADAVDIMIAHRAKLFIGNGFSSLSSSVSLLRIAHGSNPSTVRFW